MQKFTIEEFRKYLQSKDSFGDVMYFLNEENVRKANESEDIDDEDWDRAMAQDND